MPRLFTAIQLPPEIRQQLTGLYQPLPSTRWLESENLHITLRFAGDVAPPAAREFAANLGNISFDPFPVRLVGLNTFGGDAPRIIYAAIEANPQLTELARANERAARNAGLQPESRKFIPHVTLARLQAPRIEPIANFLSRRGGFTAGPFLVSEFVLYSSKPITGGGPYVVEQTFPSTLGSLDEIDWDDDAAAAEEINER